MAHDWNIKSRASECRGCACAFADGQSYWSALWHGPDGYVRGDHCETCWREKREAAVPHSAWQGVYRLPPPPDAEPLRKETAESLLRRLMESPDEANVSVMFILAVMLERKRLLVERDVQVDEAGEVTRIYEHRKTGETFLVPDPQLRLDQLESVQADVIALLEGKSSGPAEGVVDGSGDAGAHV